LNDDFVHIPLTDDGVLFQQRSIRPIHELLVRFDLWLWHKQAFGYHITALILHAIVTIQLYYLTITIQTKYFKVNAEQAQKTGLLAAVLFLLYPQHAESLAWILGRTPTLSAIFFLAMVQLFVKEKFSLTTYLLAAIFFAATLFTYEQSILFPIAFLIMAFVEKEKKLKQSKFIFSFATIAVVVFYIIARKLITTEVVGTYEGGNFNSFQIKILLGNAFRLLYRLFLNPSTTQVFSVSVSILTMLFVLTGLKNKSSIINQKFLLWLFVIAILIAPIISLGVTVRSYESGRYLYLPSIFLVIGLAIWLNHINPKWLIAFLAFTIFYWGFGKYQSSVQFKEASDYAKQTQQQVANHFKQMPSNTLNIDTLHITIHRLPVYRMGFKTGIHWFNPSIDTNKIKLGYYYDEFEHDAN
jgi:hypothetical protein